jgi:pimeloyl-ACP methyl ester carboxylesterase
MAIEALRTPDERFAALPGFPYQAHYVSDLPAYEGLRMAYVDEGPAEAPVVLCLHGEPTWAYLYRKMIPVFLQAGLRVVVPDYFGFGRSDKPVLDEVYTFDFHRNSLIAFIDALALSRVTLVVQDWGGLLGLTLPLDRPDLVGRLLIMNTALGTGSPPGDGFMAWRAYMAETQDLDVAGLMQRAAPQLTAAEAAAYAAPWPGPQFKAGVRRFPALVPITPHDPGASVSRSAAAWWAEQWQGPTFLAVGINDPILGPPVMSRMRQLIRGCPEPFLVDEGHFVQESGDLVARAALQAWA